MAKGKGFFHSKAFKVGMSRVYGIGAAIVIFGAMAKILHWPGANYWIGLGLTTESLIFLISAFEPVKEEVDWTLVYPELAGMDPKKKEEKKSLTAHLDKMLEEAKIEQGMVNRLGEGLRSLTDNINKMTTFGDAAAATNDYASKVKTAAQNVDKVNEAYMNAIEAVDKLGQTGDASAEYFEQVSNITVKLTSLNALYESELQESNNHFQQMRAFYGSLNKSVSNLVESEQATAEMSKEFQKLNQNLSTLNNVYGNMLSAMSMSRG